jgi:predicted CoA-substrate-specific enzyme activase
MSHTMFASEALPDPVHAFRIGIDLGSVTAKTVILDAAGAPAFTAYRRHLAEPAATLVALLRDAMERIGDVRVRPVLTGSAGMGLCERHSLPFVQEVIASASVVRERYPRVRSLLDIGGEDAKLIHFDQAGVPDIRMNGTCAGGTGAYLDEMANLLGVPVAELGSLAEQASRTHPIASRCGVFGKTDVQNLLSRDVPRADIAASVLRAVVLQTLATLARGLEPGPLVLFSGGPLTFIPALRAAFMHELGLAATDVMETADAQLLPATGAALTQQQPGAGLRISELAAALSGPGALPSERAHRLPPLFASEAERAGWEAARWRRKVERVAPEALGGEPIFIGLDSGSTTTKLVAVDRQGRLVFSRYTNNGGSPLHAARDCLGALEQRLESCERSPAIARGAATGYGEDMVRTAFGLDDGLVETMAHFRGARALDPDVTFVLDIGGQDMKAIFVRDGQILRMEVNEACSSGCGSFIETFATNMGQPVADFAGLACTSGAPCDLGTRCTVFMNSRIKQALKEAAAISDISAGLAYSVVKNALHKVLRINDVSVLGEHIVVQGGAFRNPAIHRALEKLVGLEVTCPDIPELMGAYGAALTARDAWLEAPSRPAEFVGLGALGTAVACEKQTINCRGCENACTVTRLTFPGRGSIFSGNRCERIHAGRGRAVRRGVSLTDKKLHLLFDRPSTPAGPPRLTLGIPRVLNTFENYPFWNTLLIECGFAVTLSDPSSSELAARGISTVMSENICFPAKIAHGHVANLLDKRVDRVLLPMVFAERPEFSDSTNSYNCPIVTGYADVLDGAMEPLQQHGIPLDMPPVTFKDRELLRRGCRDYLAGLGVDGDTFSRAFEHALTAQIEYRAELQRQGAQLIERARADGRQVIMLLGHSYHLDPFISHHIPNILTDLGVDVITEDAVPLTKESVLANRHVPTQWEPINRIYHAARWAGLQPDVEVVQLNSFGCGPDAFTLDEVRGILEESGKGHTVIRIDEIENPGSTRMRLRSLIESLRAPARPLRQPRQRRRLKVYQTEDRGRTILIPNFSRLESPIIVGPLQQMGYPVELLPPPDRESVELALRYVPNEVCYPCVIHIGDILKALNSGRHDPERVAVGSWQTGGQCRASSILSLTRKAMIAAGYDQVPIVAVTPNRKLHEQPGNDLNYLEYVPKAVNAALFADAIASMYYATAARETTPGVATALADELLDPLLHGTMPLDRRGMLEALDRAVARFNAVPSRDRQYRQVGVVGEIFVKYNAFSNGQIARWLMEQGIEIVVPHFLTFFLAWAVSSDVRVKAHLQRRDASWLVYRFLEGRSGKAVEQAEEVMQGFRYHRPAHPVREVARAASKMVSLTHAYGESWLIAGEIGAMCESGIRDIVCLQPFGCIANQVTARGVARRMKLVHPELNLLFLDLDASMSEVNYFNRLHFFVSQVLSRPIRGPLVAAGAPRYS